MVTQKNNFINIPAIILCVVIVSVFSVSLIRENYLELFSSGKVEAVNKDAFKWMEAVKGNNQTKAILYALRICGGCEMKILPDSDYLKVVSDLRISTLLLNAPFSRYDFLRWKDAFSIKEFTGGATEGKPDDIEAVFSALMNNVEYRQTPEGSPQALTMVEIIERGYGNTHETVRVLSECAYQMGYDVQTVTLFDDSGNIVHVVCEIRGKGKSMVADVRFRKFWKNMTFAKLAENPADVSGLWPENTVKAMKNHVYGIPSEFQDYKMYNQELSENLKGAGSGDIPVFGSDPKKRIEAYLKYFSSGENFIVTYWRYPFYALVSRPDFPNGWRLDYGKLLEK
jgi:hypothetical protein